MMIRFAILLMSTAIQAYTVPAAASLCAAPTAITATRTHWAALRSQLDKAADHEAACRAYAASFYELVTMRQTVASCTGYGDVRALDSEIRAFNDLLATRCGG